MARDFAQWLATKMSVRALSQTQVAAYLDINPSAVSRWLSGSSRPDPENVAKLANLFNTRVAEVYALAGHPDPDDTKPERQQLSPLDAIKEALTELPVAVPVFEQLVSAGEGQAAVMEYLWVPHEIYRNRSLFGLRVTGDSMEPDIKHGDTVIIDSDASPRDGDTVVGSVNGDVFVKQLRKKSDHYVLTGTNGLVIPAEDATIAGVVVQIVRDVPRG